MDQDLARTGDRVRHLGDLNPTWFGWFDSVFGVKYKASRAAVTPPSTTRSLPSSEVEFRGIQGRLIGEEGRGVPAIIRMVNHTRLDCLLGATTGLRRGTLEAIHHARHRSAFGALLVDQP